VPTRGAYAESDHAASSSELRIDTFELPEEILAIESGCLNRERFLLGRLGAQEPAGQLLTQPASWIAESHANS
jgi:hypothetical protein